MSAARPPGRRKIWNIRARKESKVVALPKSSKSVKATKRVLLLTPLTRAAVCLAIIVVSGAIGIVLMGNPSPKSIDVVMSCQDLVLPWSASLRLGDVSSVQVRQRGLAFHHIVRVSPTGSSNQPIVRPAHNTLLLKPDSQAAAGRAPVVRLTIDATAAEVTLTLPASANLSVRGCHSTAPCLAVRDAAGQIETQVRASQIAIAANRVIAVDDLSPPRYTEELDTVLTNPVGFVDAETTGPRVDASDVSQISFRNTSPAIALVPEPHAERTSQSVVASACLIPTALAEGKSMDTGAKDLAQDVETTGSLEIKSLALTQSPAGDRALSVRLSGAAGSLLIGGAQALPTRLDEILSSSQQNRGLFGLSAAFLLFAAGIFSKRAFDVIAAYAIPEQDGK